MALEKMIAGLSSRRYSAGLEPVGEAAADAASATSKSAVSRRFVAATETALVELMGKRLDGPDLVAFMVDGVHFGEHTCVVALGIDADGTKHPLGLEEGSTENAAVVTDLITGLCGRGLDTSTPILAVLGGAKALSRAVKDVFDKPSSSAVSSVTPTSGSCRPGSGSRWWRPRKSRKGRHNPGSLINTRLSGSWRGE
jgi:putative transposase